MSDRFYREFEERYYASREVIKELRTQYLPFVEPLAKLYPEEQIYDAGCGRGEWLELMSGLGFVAFGVDLDGGMLEACRERNLPVHQGDAITYLSSLPDDSQVVISAFHVVEHISFEQLRIFVREALRVLKPGGMLIMETPNPENILVATRNFYLDPTHVRPIPSMLLSFVAEYTGFKKVKTLRLQESEELLNKTNLNLSDVIKGASPDYAIVAQKDANEDILTLTSDAFNQEYGLSLDHLLNKWDERFNNLELKAEQAQLKAEQAQLKAEQAQLKAEEAREAAQVLNQHAHNLENNLNNLYASKSWRFTAIFRKVKKLIMRWFK